MIELKNELEMKIETIFHDIEAAFNIKIPKFCTTKLICALPFVAGCQNPERTSINNLLLYYASIDSNTKQNFKHNESDDVDIFHRLNPIMNFDGGDKLILNKGMALLALQMISGYMRDLETDRLEGEYNPFIYGKWDYQALKDELIIRINTCDSAKIDEIMSIDDSLYTWWSV